MALDASALYAECRLALARARACVDERNAYVAAHGHDDISEPAGRRPRRRTRALGAVLPRRANNGELQAAQGHDNPVALQAGVGERAARAVE